MQPTPESEHIKSIESRMNSWNEEVRMEGIDDARKLDVAEQIELCSGVLAGNGTSVDFRNLPLIVGSAVAIAVLAILLLFYSDEVDSRMSFTVFIGMMLAVGVLFGKKRALESAASLADLSDEPRMLLASVRILRHRMRTAKSEGASYSGRLQELERQLATAEDISLLPTVLELLSTSSPVTRSADQKILRTKALEWLVEFDPEEMLTETEWLAFIAILQFPYNDVDLTMAVVDAIGRLEYTRAIDTVRQLAAQGDSTHEQQLVSSAAQSALDLLMQARERELHADALLRASGEPEPAAADELLRATDAPSPHEHHDELLRAADDA